MVTSGCKGETKLTRSGHFRAAMRGAVLAYAAVAIALPTATLIAATRQAAPALSQTDSRDVECLMAFLNGQAHVSDEALNNALVMGGIYYIGKAYAASPNLDAEAIISRAKSSFDEQRAPELIKTCYKEMYDHQQALISAIQQGGQKPNADQEPVKK
jgi:hypothetical protein